jgi:hypothetical protein
MATIKELADQVYAQFEKRTRDNGREFWVLKDGNPDWMQELCNEAHGDMGPDDWKYQFVLEAVLSAKPTTPTTYSSKRTCIARPCSNGLHRTLSELVMLMMRSRTTE